MSAIEQLLYLMDAAFEPHGEHSLMRNLGAVTEDDWLWVPPGAARSIRDIVRHVGDCKYVYENHAFGDASMRWDVPQSVPSPGDGATTADVMAWLQEGHRRFRESIVHLDDEELLKLRHTNWHDMKETRWIIGVMIEHDLYHAGEINHIRALHQGNDRWAWEQG